MMTTLVFGVNAAVNRRYNTLTLNLLNHEVNKITNIIGKVKLNISRSQSPTRITYREFDPTLSLHNVYIVKHNNIHDVDTFSTISRLTGGTGGQVEQKVRLCTMGRTLNHTRFQFYSVFHWNFY